ncbi:hypothetical protein [Actinoplanes sp. DH11]|uniref:hypothetical protein n=1 Tax=Actinoplanes sp. DH11 TaxID=2857011 RepID=UPI001E5F0969|nr:hypothetical protein [Actinoplanes sp. DH11]
MNITRGLAGLTALAAIALTGCTDEPAFVDNTAGAEAAAAVARELAATVPGAAVGAYRYSSGGACPAITGVLDAPDGAISSTVTERITENGGTMTLTYLAIGDDKPYVKVAFTPPSLAALKALPKTWIAVDPKKVEDFAGSPLRYGGETDPLGTTALIGAATGVTRAGAGRYTGTADLTKVAGAVPVLDPAQITALGDLAKAVPFEATVDAASGHLTTLTVKMPRSGEVSNGTCTLTYDGYGDTKKLAEPAAGKRAKATTAVYALLND